MSRYNPCAFSVKTPPVASTISILKPCLLRRQQTILRRVDGVHAVGTIPHSFRIPSYTTMALFKRKIHSTLKKINSIDSIYFDRSVPGRYWRAGRRFITRRQHESVFPCSLIPHFRVVVLAISVTRRHSPLRSPN